jgi:hypothetical protein
MNVTTGEGGALRDLWVGELTVDFGLFYNF